MSSKTRDVGIVLLGSGVLIAAGAFAYDQWQKNKLLQEFMDKVSRAEASYVSAIDREDYAEAERLLAFYESAMRHEEEVIKEKGLLERLQDLLRQVGIVTGVFITGYVLVHILKRRPPPGPYHCPGCGKPFPTPDAVDQHIRREHPVHEPAIPDAQIAYRELPRWVQSLLQSFSGASDWMLERDWRTIGIITLIAVAAAALIIATIYAPWAAPATLAKLAKIGAIAGALI